MTKPPWANSPAPAISSRHSSFVIEHSLPHSSLVIRHSSFVIPMPAEARVTPIWKKQKLFIAVFLLAFAAYFFYDGAIGYPAGDRRYHEWKRFYDAGQLDQWPAVAEQHGWKVDEWQKWL